MGYTDLPFLFQFPIFACMGVCGAFVLGKELARVTFAGACLPS